MNIIEQEDLIKGLPDQALFQQAQNPNSQVPQFLVVSEIQRRTDMRKRFEAAEAQPQATVTDQILMEGLGATQPAPPPQGSMPPAGMPAPPSPQLPLEGSSPLMGQGMAAGGILNFNPGGVLPGQEAFTTSNEVFTGPGAAIRGGLDFVGLNYTPAGARTPEYYENQKSHTELMKRVEEIERTLVGSIRDRRKRREEAFKLAREEAANVERSSVASSDGDAWDFEEGVISPQGEVDLSRSVAESSSLFPSTEEAGFALDLGIPDPVATEYDEILSPDIVGGGGNPTGRAETEQVVDPLENLFSRREKTVLPTHTADAQEYLDSLEQARQGALSRLDSRRSESQDLIEEIRNEGRRDAFSAAMMQLGAGIAGGDLSGGLQRAGDVATSTNALARDAARAEQTGMRDYEEAALIGIDQSRVAENRFQYDQALAQDAISREQSNLDREYGLSALTAEQNTLLKIAELDQGAQEFVATHELGRDKLDATLNEIQREYDKEAGVDTRAAVQTFIDHMEQVAEYLEDEGLRMSVEDKKKYLNAERTKILSALQGRIPQSFNVFMQELQSGSATTSPSGASLTDFDRNPAG